MSRLPEIDESQLSPRQKEVLADIAGGPRGGARGPFPALIASPELADRAQKLGAFLRYETSLPQRLSEMAIIITARTWTAQYEWFAHARLAREGGLAEPIIEAIRTRNTPVDMAADEAAVYAFCSELQTNHKVSDETYAKAVAQFGQQGVVELIGLSGYYTMISMVLNTYEVALPEGEPIPLPE